MRTRVLVADDDRTIHTLLQRLLAAEGHEVVSVYDGEAALESLADSSPFTLALIDIIMPRLDGTALLRRIQSDYPRMQVIVMTAAGSIEGAVEALRLGAFDYHAKPWQLEKLRTSIRNALKVAQLRDEVDQLRQAIHENYNVVAESKEMRHVFQIAHHVMQASVPVLLTGESGVGKEVVAISMHFDGPRKAEPFVAVNCAAIPAELLESELFGHERGAFTGATHRRVGKFEEAGAGTILLDEIGEMDPRLQAKLLRVLQEREFERIGSNVKIPLRARVVAATNRNLLDEIREGRFREDLFYRLNVVSIEIPPLRQRREDIPKLVALALRKFRQREGRFVEAFSPLAMEAMMVYDWPGNVRELENVVFRACLVSATETIPLDALPSEIRKLVGAMIATPLIRSLRLNGLRGGGHGPLSPRPPMFSAVDRPAETGDPGLRSARADSPTLRAREDELIRAALRDVDGNVTSAAQRLGISRATMYRKLKRLGLS
jgi:DNA-binding NtrC family response regulator